MTEACNKTYTSIIIPTYNRPDELKNCIRSILDQTVSPDEIIVVDDGNLDQIPLEKECWQNGIACQYFKKDRPGLTASRNAGIRMAKGDILFFLDDDVVLFDTYIAEILAAYSRVPLAVGVGGIIANTKPFGRLSRIRHNLERCFLISGPREGTVLSSGFSVDFGSTGKPLRRITPVEFLPGGVSSYRREVFETFSFSEVYTGYGMGEDKDFSFRVSRKRRLVVNPRARLYHYESPKMRYDRARETREIVLGRYHLFKDYVGTADRGWWRFYYALTGYLVVRILICCISPKRRNLQRIKGIIEAFRDIITGKTTIGQV